MMNFTKIQQNLCPKCRNNLTLIVETEKKSNITTIIYSYICDVCKYKKIVDSMALKMNGNKLIVIKNSATRFS